MKACRSIFRDSSSVVLVWIVGFVAAVSWRLHLFCDCTYGPALEAEAKTAASFFISSWPCSDQFQSDSHPIQQGLNLFAWHASVLVIFGNGQSWCQLWKMIRHDASAQPHILLNDSLKLNRLQVWVLPATLQPGIPMVLGQRYAALCTKHVLQKCKKRQKYMQKVTKMQIMLKNAKNDKPFKSAIHSSFLCPAKSAKNAKSAKSCKKRLSRWMIDFRSVWHCVLHTVFMNTMSDSWSQADEVTMPFLFSLSLTIGSF